MPASPDRLPLTLKRIEEFLAILTLDYFGGDDEVGRRVIDDLHFLHRELAAGRKTLPFPGNERRPLNIAYGIEGYFSEPFSELHDRAVDLLRLFKAVAWPLLPWQADPLHHTEQGETELRSLYEDLRRSLSDRRIDELMTPLHPALSAVSLALGRDIDNEYMEEKEFIGGLMVKPDYESEAPPPDQLRILPMFDGCRVRLLHREEQRHALAVSPYNEVTQYYPIQCQFGRVDGHWGVVGYG